MSLPWPTWTQSCGDDGVLVHNSLYRQPAHLLIDSCHHAAKFLHTHRSFPVPSTARSGSRLSPYLSTLTLAIRVLSAGAGLNRTDFDALILIASPVAGLRPLRAARSVTVKVPRSANAKRPSFFNVAPMTPNTCSTTALAFALLSSCSPAIMSIISALFNFHSHYWRQPAATGHQRHATCSTCAW